MLNIGCHLSSSNGYLAMAKEAVSINANTFQFFTRNPRGGAAKDIDESDVAEYRAFASEHTFAPIIAHAPYTMNLCSADPHIRDFTRRIMADDLSRLNHTPGALYNFHPGAHVGQGVATGVAFIVEALAEMITPETTCTVLLETMAGKGTEIGGRFEELRAIIDAVPDDIRPRLGVCLDTCHASDGGYDVAGDLDGVLTSFDGIVGLERIKAVHLNDSKNPLGARKDRHEKLGQGSIGKDALVRVINHPALHSLPFILETPNELDGYAAEIATLREAFLY